ncbi:CRISPR-associated helicase Cas3' [Plasticicumulans acidivorans]|uniref:CRISPR-associated Cas3 family helicase n=1 Tax=Plasticicumulans acidivorans TaxID=886464 RepID=A0A317MZA3_9GAMM|nr:CRISPR-associated helicase Cas3' [Plasticicumulans acidivorans]PWV65555.1 CRISPR-associated Cas3 family helicase [Plasticicumulans acidivorans]
MYTAGAGYWGKTRAAWHLLPYHCLDVAAVGREYLLRHPRLCRFLAQALGLPEPVFIAWFSFFLALHDIGKFAETFQAQRSDVLRQLQAERPPLSKTSPQRHDSLGYLLWSDLLRARLRRGDWLQLTASTQRGRIVNGLDAWAAAVTGHHGQPPQVAGARVDAFSEADQQAALAFVDELAALLLAGLDAVEVADAKAFADASRRLSWWLAGITVLADWIGSNTRWFDFCDDPAYGLARYWQRACRQAAEAVAECGVLPAASAAEQTLATLFPQLPAAGASPLQQCAATLTLGDGPQLFVLEDVTGAGKTEAALLLAQRLMAAGRADGLYFALPTMATATAMYARLGRVYARLFAPGERPSLVLAHGMRDLDPQFRASILAPAAAEDDYGAGALEAASVRCRAWLADSRKKALLAQVGAGTIDQGLLGVLPTRHQSLRLLGLFGKVLICDEVHASEPYVHRLLQSLLRFHAAAGGSAILLSATLPTQMRAELMRAWAEGGGRELRLPTQPGAYPLLTQAGVGERALATRAAVARRVAVRRLDSIEQVIASLRAAAAAGRCACWIRNSVADAREAFAALAAAGVESLTLFHARFSVADRQRIEQAVVARFGYDGAAAGRAGQIVIATQVVEQSLDLDFDVLVSDLAPIDALIQRAGRLCRHRRDEHGALRAAADPQPDARGEPCLWLYGPAPRSDVDADWLRRLLPRAARVYPNHRQLWLGAHELERRGGFAMPDDARALIETVYGDGAEAPGVLDQSDIDADGARHAATTQAQLNALDPGQGYQHDGFTWADERLTPTRLGEAETLLRLAVLRDGEWCPLHAGVAGWERSQVRVLARYAKARAALDGADETAAQQAEAALPDRGRWSVLLPLYPGAAGRWHGEVLDAAGRRRTLHYDVRLGLWRDEEQEKDETS